VREMAGSVGSAAVAYEGSAEKEKRSFDVEAAIEREEQRNRARPPYLESRSRRSAEVLVTLLLIVLLAPLLCTIALAVKASSPGPILFRQARHGRNMQPFQIVKFRSMHWTGVQEDDLQQATPDDARVTRLGSILRRTSMDELPQLFNVLRGEMSLVGPRPHAVQHDFYYIELLPSYTDRFRGRPGVTGLAQVRGARADSARFRHDAPLGA
jgi:putative colanic acid biosysnthesis UDP-glucose lipid carrier transferase